MNLLLRAAIVAASFASIPPAHAVVQTPARDAQSVSTAYVVQAYVTQSKRGTWLFAPHDGEGANS